MNSQGILILGPVPTGDGGEGGDVVISPANGNLLKKESDGLKVLASHPIIPKVYTASYSTTKSAMTKQSLGDGAVIYRGELSMKNPLGITKLNNVGIFTAFHQRSNYYYLNENNEYATVLVYADTNTTTSSTISLTLSLIFSSEPFRAFNIKTGEEETSSEAGDARIYVSVQLIAGTTMGQNDFDY
ncbi:hypothetical protein [Serratia liquefaciens]|uniref:hypothetical protein n=1 Tax=Serratia liquefaciens TaxID=614 RepID=UPI003B42F74A